MKKEKEKICKRHVGKFVCYQRADGGACWGKVKDQGFVNTLKGEREVLILTDRYVRYERGRDLKNFRIFFPDPINDPELRKPMKAVGAKEDGSAKLQDFQRGELFFEVRLVPGDSTLRLESINEDKDLIDAKDLLEIVNEKTLFQALMAGRTISDALKDGKDMEVVPSSNEIFKKKYGDYVGTASNVTDGGSGALGKTAIELGLRHLIRTDKEFDEKARQLLEERFGEKVDNHNQGEGEDDEEDD